MKIIDEKNPRVRVAGILIENDSILLIQHAKKDKKYWLIPGGGIEWGETVEQALKREYKEETNLTIEVGKFLFFSETISPTKEKHVLNIYFMVNKTPNSEEMKLGEEAILSDLSFISKEALPNIKIYPNINDVLCNILNNQPIPAHLGLLWDK